MIDFSQTLANEGEFENEHEGVQGLDIAVDWEPLDGATAPGGYCYFWYVAFYMSWPYFKVF